MVPNMSNHLNLNKNTKNIEIQKEYLDFSAINN